MRAALGGGEYTSILLSNLYLFSLIRYFVRYIFVLHLSHGFKLSTDSHLVAKVRDVVGLYLGPPEKSLVRCVDEKSQIQALDNVTVESMQAL